jgi:RNA 2',3'-cyclic 3'-phosphodiesterase
MKTIRSFIAAEIDVRSRQKISELIADLKKSNADAKWITEDQMHLTLKFLGNISEGDVQKISCALSGILDNFKSFEISFSAIGAFPGIDNPSVVWLGVNKGAECLVTLNKSIELSLEQIGFKKETRSFKPHLTLARIRSRRNISNLIKTIEEINANLSLKENIGINKLTLFQSILSPKGAEYKVIRTQ